MLIAATAIAAIGYVTMRRDTSLLDGDGRGAMMWWGRRSRSTC